MFREDAPATVVKKGKKYCLPQRGVSVLCWSRTQNLIITTFRLLSASMTFVAYSYFLQHKQIVIGGGFLDLTSVRECINDGWN